MWCYLRRIVILAFVLYIVFDIDNSYSQSDISNISDLEPTTPPSQAAPVESNTNSNAKNEASIIQSSNNHIAVIDQLNGIGNFAQIIQSASTPSVAYITQSGSNNRAEIRQK